MLAYWLLVGCKLPAPFLRLAYILFVLFLDCLRPGLACPFPTHCPRIVYGVRRIVYALSTDCVRIASSSLLQVQKGNHPEGL